MAVIVGGTNYYIESLLWETLVSSFDQQANDKLILENPKSVDKELSTSELYERLKQIDPDCANKV